MLMLALLFLLPSLQIARVCNYASTSDRQIACRGQVIVLVKLRVVLLLLLHVYIRVHVADQIVAVDERAEETPKRAFPATRLRGVGPPALSLPQWVAPIKPNAEA